MTTSSDSFSFPSHCMIGRTDGKFRVHGSGMHVYSREPTAYKFISSLVSCCH